MGVISSLNKLKRKAGGLFTEFFSTRLFNHAILGNTSPILIDMGNLWKVYAENPHLKVVINEKMKMFSNARLEVVDAKTMEVVTDHPADILLKRPNPLQSQNAWMQQYSFFKDVWGNAFIYLLNGGIDPIPQVLWNMPPSDMEIVPTGKIFQQSQIEDIIQGYRFDSGKILTFEPNEIIHKTVHDDSDYLIGMSKVEGLKVPLSNIKGALQTRNVIIYNRGAIGILSNENKDNSGGIPLGDVERKQIQESYRKKYGIGEDQDQIIITNASLKWSPMSYPTKELALFEEVEENFQTICGSYGMDRDLFPSTKGATFENKRLAEIRTYQSTIQPEADDLAQSLTERFKLADEGLMIRASLAHIPVMQEDEQTKAETAQIRATTLAALKPLVDDGTITAEEMRAIMNL